MDRYTYKDAELRTWAQGFILGREERKAVQF